jgi:hypothetical protein
LVAVFIAAVQDLKADRLSSEPFQSFHAVWKAAMLVVSTHHGSGHPLPETDAVQSDTFKLVKYLQPRPGS